MKLRKYTLQQLREAVAKSTSFRQALEKLSVAPAGGNYATIKKAVKHFDIDISHFKGQGWNKGQFFGPKRPIEDCLLNRSPIHSRRLRKRLIRKGYFPHQCSKCNLREWPGKPIPLELEHKDGNHQNNALENLELLCPNCHASTSTYRGRNIKNDS